MACWDFPHPFVDSECACFNLCAELATEPGIGSKGVGSYDLYNSTPITAAQASVTGHPTNGEKLYVRLYAWINGAWQYNDYTYTAKGGTSPTFSLP